MAQIGVVGAAGFVGQHLTREFKARGHSVRAIVRSSGTLPLEVHELALGDFTNVSDWELALQGLDTVVCLAARVHVMHETESNPLQAFRRINVDVTAAIARAASRAGVRRMVYLSSIKVNGEMTPNGKPFRATDVPNPIDPYGMSKLEAEEILREISTDTGLECVIIRPPLVYGPGVGGNFLKLLSLANLGLPLPLRTVQNARAMIAVDNLVDAAIFCCSVPVSKPTVLLVNDPRSLSTPELLRQLAASTTTPIRLVPFPPSILKGFLALLGRTAEAERLLGTLDVEISSDPAGISWKPPHSSQDCLARTARWYAQTAGSAK